LKSFALLIPHICLIFPSSISRYLIIRVHLVCLVYFYESFVVSTARAFSWFFHATWYSFHAEFFSTVRTLEPYINLFLQSSHLLLVLSLQKVLLLYHNLV
jgi:hypothetical protein